MKKWHWILRIHTPSHELTVAIIDANFKDVESLTKFGTRRNATLKRRSAQCDFVDGAALTLLNLCKLTLEPLPSLDRLLVPTLRQIRIRIVTILLGSL